MLNHDNPALIDDEGDDLAWLGEADEDAAEDEGLGWLAGDDFEEPAVEEQPSIDIDSLFGAIDDTIINADELKRERVRRETAALEKKRRVA